MEEINEKLGLGLDFGEEQENAQAFAIPMPQWGVEKMTGYTPKTTFWQDFSIADRFGTDAIRDTYKRAFGEWKDNYVYLTELVMVLNHKSWQMYDAGKYDASELYVALYEQACEYAYVNLAKDELRYFNRILD